MTKLKIDVLGGLRISSGSEATAVPLTRKGQAVLAFLALQQGRPQSREKLAALFWENSPEGPARTNLRQCLSALRNPLGSILMTEQDSVSLDAAVIDIDAARFEDLVTKSKVEALEEAVTIYHGELLEGFNIKEEAFEAWVRAERERYRSLMIDGLTKLIECYLANDRIDALIMAAHRLITIDPLNEGGHRSLMHAYAAQGRLSLALKEFERCKDRLRHEIGAEPEAETMALARELRARRMTSRERSVKPDSAGATLPDRNEKSIPAVNLDLTLPSKPSIAILPFTNLSGDPEQDYLSDGITEDIITEISRFSSLFVIARDSSFAYRENPRELNKVADDLGVRYVLIGSVRRTANRVRLNAQLVDTGTNRQVWAERFDRELDDIFELQDEITRDVVGSIAPQIDIAEIDRARRAGSGSASAYDLALRARAQLYEALRTGSRDRCDQAIAFTRHALELDPCNAQALETKAFAYYMKFLYCWDSSPANALKIAWESAERLIEFDWSNSNAYTLRGEIRIFRDEHDAAMADFQRAYSLNPNSAWNLFYMACCESIIGQTDEARKHAWLGLRLSPRDVDIGLGVAYLTLAQASFADGDFIKAKEWGTRALQMQSQAPYRRTLMIACCGHLGHLEEAARHASALNSFAPEFFARVRRGEFSLYRLPEHNALLSDGLRKAGILSAKRGDLKVVRVSERNLSGHSGHNFD